QRVAEMAGESRAGGGRLVAPRCAGVVLARGRRRAICERYVVSRVGDRNERGGTPAAEPYLADSCLARRVEANTTPPAARATDRPSSLGARARWSRRVRPPSAPRRRRGT